MKERIACAAAIVASLLAACGDDEGSGGGASTSATTGSSTSGQTTSGTSTTTATTTSSQTSTTTTTGTSGSGGGPTCTQAREDALGPIDMVSSGDALTLENAGGVATLFIDASAGGIQNQAINPWIYVDFEGLARVDVTDVTADADTTWDLAIKRPILRTNSGDGGYAGSGGAVRLTKAFDEVTEADAAATFETEIWFDEKCNLYTDPTGAIATTFDGWYDYDNGTVSPGAGTWLIRGGDGVSVFKLEVLDYYSNPDGTSGMAGGRYRVRVADVTP